MTGLLLNENILTIDFNKVSANGASPTGLTAMGHKGGLAHGTHQQKQYGQLAKLLQSTDRCFANCRK
jgi:hypothetical protein